MGSSFGNIDPQDFVNGEWMPVEGGGGSCYECFKGRVYGQMHFIKRVRPDRMADPVCRQALRKEFMVGYAMDHPGVVRYLRYEDDTVYQEYIDGDTIGHLITAHDPAIDVKGFAIGFCRQLLQAVGYLHSRGVVHLDIKPDNIMVTRLGAQVKLVDLGCCRTAVHDNTPGSSPGYSAPEQEEGADAGFATDIYQVGVVMDLLTSHLGQRRRWRRFIARATAADPAARFADTAQALAAIPAGECPRRLLVWGGVAVALTVAVAVWLTVRFPRQATVEEAVPVPPATVTDTVATHQPSATGEVTPSSSPSATAPTADPFDDIAADIRTQIQTDYRNNVYPLLDPALQGDRMDITPYSAAAQQAVAAAFDRSARLGEQYPLYADRIHQVTDQTVRDCQNHCGGLLMRLERHFENPQ